MIQNARREMWRPDQSEIGFDIGLAAEDIMTAAGIRVYCDEDPFRIDCMRAVLRRLEHMTSGNPYAPTPDERREAIEQLEQLIVELRAANANTKPINYTRATELARASIERQEEAI